MQITPVQTAPSQRTWVIGTFHQPLPATATAKPVTHAIAATTRPCASRKLRSLGTSASTRASAPANHAAQPILRRSFTTLLVLGVGGADRRPARDADANRCNRRASPCV